MSDGLRVLKSRHYCIIRAKVSNELSSDLSSVLTISCFVISVAPSAWSSFVISVRRSKCELDVLIVVSLEVVEEVAENNDPLISLS